MDQERDAWLEDRLRSVLRSPGVDAAALPARADARRLRRSRRRMITAVGLPLLLVAIGLAAAGRTGQGRVELAGRSPETSTARAPDPASPSSSMAPVHLEGHPEPLASDEGDPSLATADTSLEWPVELQYVRSVETADTDVEEVHQFGGSSWGESYDVLLRQTQGAVTTTPGTVEWRSDGRTTRGTLPTLPLDGDGFLQGEVIAALPGNLASSATDDSASVAGERSTLFRPASADVPEGAEVYVIRLAPPDERDETTTTHAHALLALGLQGTAIWIDGPECPDLSCGELPQQAERIMDRSTGIPLLWRLGALGIEYEDIEVTAVRPTPGAVVLPTAPPPSVLEEPRTVGDMVLWPPGNEYELGLTATEAYRRFREQGMTTELDDAGERPELFLAVIGDPNEGRLVWALHFRDVPVGSSDATSSGQLLIAFDAITGAPVLHQTIGGP